MDSKKSQSIKQKFKIVEDLFNIAYKTKSFQLRKKHPDWTDQQIHEKTLELIDKGSES
jgi:hypothetical protein